MKHKLKLCVQLPVPDGDLAPFTDLVERIKELGYAGIEPCVRNPRELNQEQLAGILASRGMAVPALATGRGKRLDGLSLLDPDPAIARRAVQRLKDQTDLLVKLGGARLILGSMKGMAAEGEPRESALERLIPALHEVLDYVESKGCMVVLEAMNRYETNLCNTAAEACELARRVGRAGFKILLDTFHMNIEERDAGQAIRNAGDLLGHVHLVDSDRRGCGSGHIDFAAVLEALDDTGYGGFVTLEQFSDPDILRAARMTMGTLAALGVEPVLA